MSCGCFPCVWVTCLGKDTRVETLVGLGTSGKHSHSDDTASLKAARVHPAGQERAQMTAQALVGGPWSDLHPTLPGVQTHQVQDPVRVPGQLGHLGQRWVLPDQDLVLRVAVRAHLGMHRGCRNRGPLPQPPIRMKAANSPRCPPRSKGS